MVDRIETITKTFLGPIVVDLMADPTVMDIMYRPNWVAIDRVGTGLQVVPEAIGTARVAELLRLFGPIISMHVPDQTEIIELSLPGFRSRFSGKYIGRDGERSSFTIRKATVKGLSLEQYLAKGVITHEVYEYLLELVSKKTRGILIGGATGSGKTTFLEALIRQILKSPRKEHLLIVEDTPELWIEHEFVTSYVATPRTNYRAFLRAALRDRPDRIIVGEVRGGEALEAVKAGATGHGLMMTIHAETAEKAVRTLCSRVAEGTDGHVNTQVIAQAIDTVIIFQRSNEQFFLSEISTLESIQGEEIVLKKVFAR